MQVKATPHKMLYGHYLQKKHQHMGVHCVARSILERDHPEFLRQAEERWEALEKKRTIKFGEDESQKKRMKAMHEGAAGVEDSSEARSSSQGKGAASKETAWAFLPAAEKQKRREECQAAWDLAFAVSGIKFMTSDEPVFRAAVAKTSACPDFTIACSKTMRTSRLDKLNDEANRNKDIRMKAGLKFGFVVTSDGWRSVAKRQYHNYILISAEGPIFVELNEVTGQGGTGEDVHMGFEAVFERLGPEITSQVVLGVTDTPSANKKAWRLLEVQHPKQLWVGCAAHEVALLFKEWTKNISALMTLFRQGLKVVKWVNNHSEILKLFRDIVPTRFNDKRRHCLTLYMPGDTRFMTVFKMLQRILVLWEVLVELVNRSEYEKASQKALKQWSDNQPPEKKLQTVDGRYPDMVQHLMRTSSFKKEIECFVNATKSAVFLLRLVDGHSPVLGKFYYSCALVDKHLRVLEEGGQVPYIAQLRSIFAKRWKRWHRPVHTLAYALDPCYQGHDLTRTEKKDCLEVIKKLSPANWAATKLEFDRWRGSSSASLFPEEVWKAADSNHGYLWWESFGDDFEHLQPLATKLLSKAISASACEFNWSDVGQVRHGLRLIRLLCAYRLRVPVALPGLPTL